MVDLLAQAAGPAPAEFGWWLASRAAGVVALLCVALSVGLGLAMAAKVVARRPHAQVGAVHQHVALAGLVAIAVHGITLLGDGFLSPSLGDLAIPFTSEHEPLWTGLGVTGGWLAAGLGLTYWIRDRIGPARWRSLHRLTTLVYVLAVAHTLGAGTDAGQAWMVALLVVTGAPVLFLLVMRILAPRPEPAWRRLRVDRVTRESADVLSFELVPAGRRPLAPFAPGQFVPTRAAGQIRTYSLSSAPGGGRYRISVRRDGVVSTHLHEHVREGDALEVGRPAGAFVLEDGERPVVLLSCGIGATPVLSMLAALAAEGSRRAVWWVHGARRRAEHPFRNEVLAHLALLPNGFHHVSYSRPDPWDEPAATGRLTAERVLAPGVPLDATFHVCGTPGFVADLTDGLRAAGVAAERIRSEAFGGAAPAGEAARVGGAAAVGKAAPVGGGPAVAFARSDVTTAWDDRWGSLLDLAEAHAVPATPGCRVGACHGCRTPVLSGRVRHEPEPLAPPPDGHALLCCARPEGDVVLDV